MSLTNTQGFRSLWLNTGGCTDAANGKAKLLFKLNARGGSATACTVQSDRSRSSHLFHTDFSPCEASCPRENNGLGFAILLPSQI